MFNRSYYDDCLSIINNPTVIRGIQNKKILITGATGLIGSFLVDALSWLNENESTGIEIYAGGRSEARLSQRFEGLLGKPYFHCCLYDATQAFCPDFETDIVVHAANSAHPLAYSMDPVGIMQANLIGTMQFLECLKKQGHGRFLIISSGETYGENPGLPEGFSETDYGWIDTMLPRACYPESKRAAETLCASYAAQYGVDAVVARLCHVYGPTFTASNSRADAQFIRKALAGEDIVMKSTGSQVRSFCYVADAVNALLTVLAVGEKGQAYNVANRHSVASIRQYAETLADIAGVQVVFDVPPEVEKAGYTKVTRAVLNPAKLEKLGWMPRYDLRQGLEATYRCCKRE